LPLLKVSSCRRKRATHCEMHGNHAYRASMAAPDDRNAPVAVLIQFVGVAPFDIRPITGRFPQGDPWPRKGQGPRSAQAQEGVAELIPGCWSIRGPIQESALTVCLPESYGAGLFRLCRVSMNGRCRERMRGLTNNPSATRAHRLRCTEPLPKLPL